MSAAQGVIDDGAAATPGDSAPQSRGLHPRRPASRARTRHSIARPRSRRGTLRGYLRVHAADGSARERARSPARGGGADRPAEPRVSRADLGSRALRRPRHLLQRRRDHLLDRRRRRHARHGVCVGDASDDRRVGGRGDARRHEGAARDESCGLRGRGAALSGRRPEHTTHRRAGGASHRRVGGRRAPGREGRGRPRPVGAGIAGRPRRNPRNARRGRRLARVRCRRETHRASRGRRSAPGGRSTAAVPREGVAATRHLRAAARRARRVPGRAAPGVPGLCPLRRHRLRRRRRCCREARRLHPRGAADSGRRTAATCCISLWATRARICTPCSARRALTRTTRRAPRPRRSSCGHSSPRPPRGTSRSASRTVGCAAAPMATRTARRSLASEAR